MPSANRRSPVSVSADLAQPQPPMDYCSVQRPVGLDFTHVTDSPASLPRWDAVTTFPSGTPAPSSCALPGPPANSTPFDTNRQSPSHFHPTSETRSLRMTPQSNFDPYKVSSRLSASAGQHSNSLPGWHQYTYPREDGTATPSNQLGGQQHVHEQQHIQDQQHIHVCSKHEDILFQRDRVPQPQSHPQQHGLGSPIDLRGDEDLYRESIRRLDEMRKRLTTSLWRRELYVRQSAVRGLSNLCPQR